MRVLSSTASASAGGLSNCLYDSNVEVVTAGLEALEQVLAVPGSGVLDCASCASLAGVLCSKLLHGKGEDIGAKAQQCVRMMIKVLTCLIADMTTG